MKEEGYTISKTALIDLKLTGDKEEIKGYYNKESDRLLYEALKNNCKDMVGRRKRHLKNHSINQRPTGRPVRL